MGINEPHIVQCAALVFVVLCNMASLVSIENPISGHYFIMVSTVPVEHNCELEDCRPPCVLLFEYLRCTTTEIETTFAVLQRVIIATRDVLARNKLRSKDPVDVHIHFRRPIMRYIALEWFEDMLPHNRRVGEDGKEIIPIFNLQSLQIIDTPFDGQANYRKDEEFDLFVHCEHYEDEIGVVPQADTDRLKAELERIDKQLANVAFLAKAKPEVIEKFKKRQQEIRSTLGI